MSKRPKHDTTTPLAFLLSVMRDENLYFEIRRQAAVDAASYCHRRLYKVEHVGEQADPVFSAYRGGEPVELH